MERRTRRVFSARGLNDPSMSPQTDGMSVLRRMGGRVVVALLCAACGGGQRGADAPAQPSPAGEANGATDPDEPLEAAGAGNESKAEPGPAASERATGLPKECTESAGLCLPPRGFVKRLCLDAYSGAAIALFEKSSPFSRGYVRSREVKSVNTQGGPASDLALRFGEEVVILTHTGGPGANQMQVSGMGGYDVLRWDGTCATLADEELALRPPVAPRHPPFAWRYIDSNIQAALLTEPSIEAARKLHRKHCHGVSLGRISAACVKAEAELNDSITTAVRAGIALPTPERMP
jgi:hypothetical protein